MMGDQSQSKRADGKDIEEFLLADLYGDGEIGAVELVREADRRPIGVAIPQGRVANARHHLT